MHLSPQQQPFLVDFAAGAAAAITVLISFGIFHTLWIVNVPAVFAEGALHALPPALALAWAIRATGRTGWSHGGIGHGLIIGLVLWLTLMPYEVVGVIWGPWVLPHTFRDVVSLSWLGFLGAPLGAAFGWTATRKLGPTVAWAATAVMVNITLGGSIAFFGGRGAMLGLFFWLLPTYLLAGLALSPVHSYLRPRDAPA